MDTRLYLGADGGGTRCRVRIRTNDGTLVGAAEGGSANIFSNPVAARRCLLETAEQALLAGGLTASALPRCVAGLGLAGANLSEAAGRFDAASLPFARTVLTSDAITACLGAHGGADGGIAILGTGSAYVARVAGRDTIFGGWGLAVSDGGSAADLGRAALAATLLAHDGLGPGSSLTDHILAAFPGGAPAIAGFAGTASPADLGRYGPAVWDSAAAGDAVANAILQPRLAEIARGLWRLLALGAPRLALLGGQAGRYLPYLEAGLQAQVRPPLADAVEGALMLVMPAQQAGPHLGRPRQGPAA